MTKIIRNISLTIGIICGVFFICAKIGHCETLAEPYPTTYPMQPSWDFTPWINNAEAQQRIINTVDTWINTTSLSNKKYLLQISRASGNGTDVYMYYNNPYQAIYPDAGTYLLEEWLNDTETRFGIVGVRVTFNFDANGYATSTPTYNHNSDNSFFNQYNGQKRSAVAITKGTVNNNYIFYVSSAWTKLISQNNKMIDTQEPSIVQYVEPFPEAEEALQSIIPITSEIAEIGETVSGTLADMQQGTLRSWLNSIIQELHNGTTYIASAFSSAFLPFWNNFKNFVDWIKDKWTIFNSIEDGIKTVINILDDDLTPQNIADTFIEGWQSITLYRVVQDGIYIKDAILSLGNVEPQAPTISITLPATFFGKEITYTTDFAWYENIRTAVTTFFVAFITVGLGIHIFVQIPSYIHGMSGSAHGLQQGAITTPQEDWRSEYARRNNYI